MISVVRPIVVLTLIAGMVTAGPVAAKVYKYQDKWGMTHIVDSPAKVPPEYKDQIEEKSGGGSGYRLQQASEPLVAPATAPVGSRTGAPEASSAVEAKRKRCDREIAEQNARIRDLKAKADQWVNEELTRSCGSSSKTEDGGCYYISARGGMKDMLTGLRAEVEARNPYRAQVADEELRLKKIEGNCR